MLLKKIKIGEMITLYNEKNINNIDYPFYGINIFKEFMPSVANTSNVVRNKYKVVKNFKAAATQHYTKQGALLSAGFHVTMQILCSSDWPCCRFWSPER